ncbi:DUF2382 domain-containing protein [uncultured Jatrophihabitans sp.]|uniref:DUF2382 domain-containing protein n=1 Tax=uncultured Jatrophihabitans sp. TaxID=1610747 RepID=UPI0035C99E46
MTTISDPATIAGATVVDRDGDKIGKAGQVYLDDTTGQPVWVTVKTGLFGNKDSFAPLAGASQDGENLTLSVDKAKVKDAPTVEDDGHLSEQEQDALYDYYAEVIGSARPANEGTFDADTTGGAGGPGHDTSGPNTDNAMTRSEEQLHVGTEQVAAGRAKLRKYIVTENVTQTVPVSHEEVRVEREPITDANIGDAADGPAISEEEHEVTLHAERPVVQKEAVPVERVRLATETVTDQEQVSEEVRQERIDVEGDGTATR